MMHVRKPIYLVSFRNHMCTHMNTFTCTLICTHTSCKYRLSIMHFKEHYSSLKTENLAVGEKTEDTFGESNILLLYEARTLGMLVVFIMMKI